MTESSKTYDFDRSKLNLTYDVEKLRADVLAVIQQGPPFYIHYNVIPLTTAGVKAKEVTDFSDPDWTTWTETSFMESCPYIREVLDSLKCRKTNIRLMRLEPGGELKKHTDPQLNLDFHNQVRLHVPIILDEHVQFVLNEKPVPLQAGELWYLRLSDPHYVINRSPQERIQLSIDVVVNDWIEGMICDGVQSA